jgi:hypothetical protein
VQVSKSPSRTVHFDSYSRTGKSKAQLFAGVFEYPKMGGWARVLLSFSLIIGGLNKSIDTDFLVL